MFRTFSRPSGASPLGDPAVEAPAAANAARSVQVVPTPEEESLVRLLELKSRLHEALLDRLNFSVIDKVEPEELRREVSALVLQVLSEEGAVVRGEEHKKIVEELMDEVLGYGPLEPLLADPTINDILVNGHRHVYVERHGVLERVPTRFRDEKHLLRIIDKIVSRVGRRVDESQPWVDARLDDGSRVNAIIRPCSIDGPSMSIRKFSKKPYTMDRLVEAGSLSQQAAAFLQGLVEARMNILISGGTGSGKTTMLNALSSFIDHRERIVTIEDAAELQLQQDHIVRLETRPPNPSGGGAVHQRDLVKNALRMRPDRIIVGEVRGAETFDMLQAMNTGHDGSMTTVHANTARDALGRIEQMVTMTGIDFPMSAVRAQIASGLHFILQLNRLADGRRRTMSISEITGMEGNVISMQDIFVFRKRGRGEDGEVLGDFVPTGIRPRCADQLLAAGVSLDLTAFQHRAV
ncbi:CpaF family protein [Wenxinia marina]|uniref:Flp pilus assembly protein, ATPase CpaF n=1 Tax=Wenxinia marina DSM 24838 TaxID=1123501 RepID=A0A0D0QAU1_9RHOB|nr:CpaF family protein [Wenxinia marina]KIQ69422.1 Flp pilus assembly protein, ATPase CpaF [Wenxinia marina DSM 24838]GGL58198.1 CpaF pilus assembly protein, ATPase CpaF [Wenxinia marina]